MYIKVKCVGNDHFGCGSLYDLLNFPRVTAITVNQHFLLIVKRISGQSPHPNLSVQQPHHSVFVVITEEDGGD